MVAAALGAGVTCPGSVANGGAVADSTVVVDDTGVDLKVDKNNAIYDFIKVCLACHYTDETLQFG